MLTPSKIKNHHFEASGKNAYRAQSVDDFFDIVADSYEQMFKENGELVKKISLLAERVEEYRNDEDNIRAALLTAQRMADQIMRETNEKAEAQLAEAVANAKKIEEDAAAKAKELVESAQAKADAKLIDAAATAKRLIEDATAEAKEQAVVARDKMIKTQAALGLVEKEADSFKKQLLDLYREHIELIAKIPEVQAEEPVEEPEEEQVEDIDTAPVAEEEPAEEEIEAAAPVVEEEPAAPAEVVSVVETEPTEEVIEEDVSEPEIEEEAIEEPAEEEDITDEMLERMGLDVPSFSQPAEENLASKYSFIDEDDEYYEEEEAKEAPVAEVDDGYDEDDGIKFDINSIRFSAAEEDDDDEYYDDDDDDDDYYDDDDDDDDGDGFGSKLKDFFKR